jgi:hypothetical protein
MAFFGRSEEIADIDSKVFEFFEFTNFYYQTHSSIYFFKVLPDLWHL